MPDSIELTNWILVPIALREDVAAILQLPRHLSKSEAEKIARVVLTYAD